MSGNPRLRYGVKQLSRKQFEERVGRILSDLLTALTKKLEARPIG